MGSISKSDAISFFCVEVGLFLLNYIFMRIFVASKFLH